MQVSTAVGHTNVINCLSFSGANNYLASGSDDGTVKSGKWTAHRLPRPCWCHTPSGRLLPAFPSIQNTGPCRGGIVKRNKGISAGGH
ncbi:MAG: hypothetical protein HC859_11840 [Bacteroidia bacterium]|nr:hypothetical protein [Bacteroidia bacterium]